MYTIKYLGYNTVLNIQLWLITTEIDITTASSLYLVNGSVLDVDMKPGFRDVFILA